MSSTITIIGAGAIGGTITAWLAQRGDLDVSVCVRSPVDEVHVRTPTGPISARPRVFLRPDQIARSTDWVLIATKTYDAPGAAACLPKLIGQETRVAVLQNGVEHVERFGAYLDKARIVPAIVDIPAERNEPGNIWQRRAGSILVPEGSEGLAFVELFSKTPITVSTTANFLKAAWEKLCLNCVGAVSALTLQPAGVARQTPIATIMRALAAECVAVGAAEGAALSPDLPDVIVKRYQDGPPDAINSMHADRIAGRPMEIDARNGVIVRLGAKYNIATPMNALVVALLEAAALRNVATDRA